MKNVILVVLLLCLCGCGIKTWDLNSEILLTKPNGTEKYSGHLVRIMKLDRFWGRFLGDLNNGTLVVNNGPGGEDFTGDFVVINKTPKSTSRGSGVLLNPIAQPGQIPIMGAASKSSTAYGEANNSGYWYATGSGGSSMKCLIGMDIELVTGQGTCEHSNGNQYEVLLFNSKADL